MNGDRISVVTPTLGRPEQVHDLLLNLAQQTTMPFELVLVDGAPKDNRTEEVVQRLKGNVPYLCRYHRFGGGTAVQRNFGIDRAIGDYIAFIDDDIRLHPDFFRILLDIFESDTESRVGGIIGFCTTDHFRAEDRLRWRCYRRLRLLSTFEPGRYDFETGYPVNRNTQPPFSGTRRVDFMGAGCVLWRRKVFDEGLRFDEFFRDYGVLEDAHLSLRASKSWNLLFCGDALCEHLHSPGGRPDRRRIGYKSVVNYYYVFSTIAGPLTLRQQWRFWRFQAFELLRMAASGIVRMRRADFGDVVGRLQGIRAVATGRWKHPG